LSYLTLDPSPDGAKARTEHVKIPLPSGEKLHGVLLLPGGHGPHPVVLLLHGFPGWERNFDVAHALRRAGYAALVFHYRGCWGMPGRWSWAHALADTEVVLELLRQGSIGKKSVLDSSRIAVAGHSLGGFLALSATATRPWVNAVCSIAGFDFGAAAAAVRGEPSLRRRFVEAFASETAILSDTSGESLTAEMEAAGDTWSLRNLALSFRARAVMLLGTDFDDVAPAELHHHPLVDSYLNAGVHLTHDCLPTDHALADHRVALTRSVVEFVSTNV
jgi:pimeloyl-ACP methyl ester carboxylesterase